MFSQLHISIRDEEKKMQSRDIGNAGGKIIILMLPSSTHK